MYDESSQSSKYNRTYNGLKKKYLQVPSDEQRIEESESRLAGLNTAGGSNVLELFGHVRILFALDQIDSLQTFLKERLRMASFPKSLDDDAPAKKVLRVRHK